ncbi:MAG: MBL fold metallo-hydrolase, partial [Planctomycetes bacterium]|nr:MBL fold metallo-hydrolase [Planctomycetota bacterium]
MPKAGTRLWVAFGLLLCVILSSEVRAAERETTMVSEPVRLSEHLHQIADTCNVYLLVDDEAALAIDFGSGVVLEHLSALGVKQLEWVLHTHYHRDQCQGDGLAVAAGVKVAVPEAERQYFESAEAQWAEGKVPGPFFGPRHLTLRENVPVAKGLVAGQAFE